MRAIILGVVMSVLFSSCQTQSDVDRFTIVCLGDSTTAGTPGFLSPSEHPPEGQGDVRSQYAYWLQQRSPNWQVLNRGVRGQRTDQIKKRWSREVLSAKPQVVVVLAGVNDLYQGYDEATVKKNLSEIYELAAKAHIRVVASTILPYNFSTPEVREKMDHVNQWIRQYSAEHGLFFCDLFTALQDPRVPHTLLGSPDGIHPDIEGYHLMADALKPMIDKALENL